MENLKERIKNRIAENRQLMVTAKFPHIYYQAVGTRKLEQILEEEFENQEKTCLLSKKCKACGMIFTDYAAGYNLCPNCGHRIDYKK